MENEENQKIDIDKNDEVSVIKNKWIYVDQALIINESVIVIGITGRFSSEK